MSCPELGSWISWLPLDPELLKGRRVMVRRALAGGEGDHGGSDAVHLGAQKESPD
jgi:hypothetical protein